MYSVIPLPPLVNTQRERRERESNCFYPTSTFGKDWGTELNTPWLKLYEQLRFNTRISHHTHTLTSGTYEDGQEPHRTLEKLELPLLVSLVALKMDRVTTQATQVVSSSIKGP